MLLKASFFCRNGDFEAANEEFKVLIADAKKLNKKVTISVKDNARKTAKFLTLTSEDNVLYQEFYEALKQLTMGDLVENPAAATMVYDASTKAKLISIEREIGNARVEYDARTRNLRVYGATEKRTQLKHAVLEYLKLLAMYKQCDYDLRGGNKVSGLMKALVKKYGVDMKKALPSDAAGTIQVSRDKLRP